MKSHPLERAGVVAPEDVATHGEKRSVMVAAF
jgi:hypothetical protein